MQISLENDKARSIKTASELQSILAKLSEPKHTFFILEQSDGGFLQAALVEDRFWIGKCDPADSQLYRAFASDHAGLWSFADMSEIARCYLVKADCRIKVDWEISSSSPHSAGKSVWAEPRPYEDYRGLVGKVEWFQEWLASWIARAAVVLMVGAFALAIVAVGYLALRDILS